MEKKNSPEPNASSKPVITPGPIRCRRLGHEVPIDYCSAESGEGKPCRLILDCWWEVFDIKSYVRDQFPAEVADRLENPSGPPQKILSLIELIEQARKNKV